MNRTVIIAIDGPGASGKGTLARRLAAHLGYAYLDTGAMYRAVALQMLQAGADPADAQAALVAAQNLDTRLIDDRQLRTDRVGEAASRVAAHEDVRQALMVFQRSFATNPPGKSPGAVLDGRDIGTVICPDAQVKLFVTASPEARAHRRYTELGARGEAASEAKVLAELQVRDARDQTRSVAPLRAAPDAVILDTTDMAIDAAFAAALSAVAGKIASNGEPDL
ncbi:MAG: (d)CMP kinase [Alphaproteobacteria bacterium]|nr:(d)CMP kinase [Alphaproteobacteria bacterium]